MSLETGEPLVERPAELLLLGEDEFGDPIAPLRKLRVGVAHELDDQGDQGVEEGLPQVELAAVPRGAPQDAAHHVAATLVGRIGAVGEGEAEASHVIRDDAVGDPGPAAVVGLAAQADHGVDERPEDVGLVDGVDAVEHHAEPLEAHPRVDARPRQLARPSRRAPARTA